MALSKFAKEDVCPACGAKKCDLEFDALGVLDREMECYRTTRCSRCSLEFDQVYVLEFAGHNVDNEYIIPEAKPL